MIATYVLDTSTGLSASGDRPLTATSNSNTTFYLYGLGGIGEETTAWSYSLPDGTNTPRQLSDLSGEITLSARYTPWGDTLDTYGSGNFTFGYLGGVLDATTGLLYVGNGQYYDPATGRFLTRDVYPNNSNPYVPWNPIGALLGPLALVSLFYTRRKKVSKTGTFLVLLLVLGGVGMTLAACGAPAGPVTATVVSTPRAPVAYTATFAGGTTVTGTLPASGGAPSDVLAVPCQTPGALMPAPNSMPVSVNLWIESENWMVSDTDVKKEIWFRFTVMSGDPHDYALVQFVKGYGKILSTGSYVKAKILGQLVDVNYPNWVIDSADADPVYGSNSTIRWNYFQVGNSSTYSTSDRPNAPRGTEIFDDFKMCIFEINDVPTNGLSVNVEGLMAKNIKCVDWEFKVTHYDDGTVAVHEDR